MLLPVKLTKKKGIRDTYSLEPLSSEAEVNPVVRHQFRQLYDIELPETIDLASTSLDEFFDYLKSRDSGQRARGDASADRSAAHRPDPRKGQRRLDQYRRQRAGVRPRRAAVSWISTTATTRRTIIRWASSCSRPRSAPPGSRLARRSSKTRRGRGRLPCPTGGARSPNKNELVLSGATKRRRAIPTSWNFDLCSVTLANFRYRRMSLVRDYEALLEQQSAESGLRGDVLASRRARRLETCRDAAPLAERFDVVPCDPTQATAIAEARGGAKLHHSGPPGTGKSQTITNLIADFVARGKRVLFVCEKRAAIDVVYARLRQCGLGRLCCLIHDSQTDKKEFVLDLKQTYENFIEEQPATASSMRHRADVLRQQVSELVPLEHVDVAMQAPPSEGGLAVRSLLGRAIELNEHRPTLSPLEQRALPNHAVWQANRDHIRQLASTRLESCDRTASSANIPCGCCRPA